MNVVLTPATIAKLELGPNDVVVIRSSMNLTSVQAGRIWNEMKTVFPDHKVMVLSPNLSISTVHKDAA